MAGTVKTPIGLVGQGRNRLEPARHLLELQPGLAFGVISEPVSLLPRPSDAEDRDLLILNLFRRGEPVDGLVAKVHAQHLGAVANPGGGNHEHKHTAGPQSAITVFQKQRFQTPVAAIPDFEIKGLSRVRQKDSTAE